MEFKVKRDFLPIFCVNLFIAFLLCIVIPFVLPSTVFFIIIITLILTVAVLFNTSVIFANCKLTDETLIFKTGVFKYTIKLNQIKKVSFSANTHASLALSCDRIRILTVNENNKQKVYYISVEDNEKLASIISPTKKVEKEVEQKVEVTPVVKKEQVETKKVATKKTATTKKTTSATKKPATKKTTTKTQKATTKK